MGLSQEEIEQFFKLHGQLLLFVNKRKKLFDKVLTLDDLPKLGPENIIKIRDFILKEPNLIISFISENPNLLSKEELQIIEKWKDGIYGEFYIVKYDKEYTLFYSPDSNKCYGVLGLFSKFDEMLGPYLPILVKARLIPFKNKIIYDGLILPYNVSFGSGYRSSIKAEYEESIVKNGIITSLDVKDKKIEDGDNQEEELLKFYLKSEANRNRYYKEIDHLKIKSPELKKIYSQEMGKLNSRYIKKKIKEKNIEGWFGILDDFIISSGKSKNELFENLNKMLGDKQLVDSVYIFKI